MTKKAWFISLLIVFACVLGLAETPDASADANTYADYLQSHGTFAGGPNKALAAGLYVCQALHSGASSNDLLAHAGLTFMNVAGVIEAAQHELCPDTLGKP